MPLLGMMQRLVLASAVVVGLGACGATSNMQDARPAPGAAAASTPTAPPVTSHPGKAGRNKRATAHRVYSKSDARLPESHASSTVVQRQPPAGSCHASNSSEFALPDPRCTPGALNPAVDQADINSTICVPGWSESVRPPERITETEKFASLAAYGDPDDPSSYEYDHLVPLELGGAPNDPRNLWPEPGGSPNPKDTLEGRLHDLVCAGQLSLARAQREIAKDWVRAYRRYVGPTSGPPSHRSHSAGAWCTASARPADDGYSGDYDVFVRSNQPDVKARATDATDSYWEYTNASGDTRIRLYYTSAGEKITVTVGAASCSTAA